MTAGRRPSYAEELTQRQKEEIDKKSEDQDVRRVLRHEAMEIYERRIASRIAQARAEAKKANQDEAQAEADVRAAWPPPEFPAEMDQEFYAKLGRQDSVGLAFSGGGIRSATFNLGVLQALAKLKLLSKIDYLSTVSGGGYIGSWFAAWIQHAAGGLAEVQKLLHPERIGQVDKKPQDPPQSGEAAEPWEIFHLRRFSNYLSPKLGFMSADMWVLFAIYLRNFLMCQLVLLPAVVGVLLLSRLLMVFYHTDTPGFVLPILDAWTGMNPNSDHGGAPAVFIALFWLIAATVAFIGASYVRSEDTARDGAADKKRLSQGCLLWGVVLPVMAAAIMFCWLPSLRLFELDRREKELAVKGQVEKTLILGIPRWYVPEDASTQLKYFGVPEQVSHVFLAFFLVPTILVVSAYLISTWFRKRTDHFWSHVGALAASCAFGGIMLFWLWTFLLWLCTPGPSELTDYVHARAAARITTFGPPMVLGVQILTVFIGIALLRKKIGEEMREWWSRLCAWLMIVGVIWMAVNLVAIYATALVIWAGPWAQAALGSGWIASVVSGVLAGGSAGTGAKKTTNTLQDWVAAMAPAVFVVGLLIGVSLGMHDLLDIAPNGEAVADTAEWGRRDEPPHPPIRITETKTETKTRIESKLKPEIKAHVEPETKTRDERTTERKQVIDRARAFDEKVVVGLVFWVSMFNTDASFVPTPKYHLSREDIVYLQKQRQFDANLAQMLFAESDAIVKAGGEPLRTKKDFFKAYEGVLGLVPSADEALPGQVTQDEIFDIATDADMIKFVPGLIIAKLLIAIGVCLVLFVLAIWFVDVNRFSLHALYGNRLTRGYLGASNTKRSADPFSGFDPADDLNLTKFRIQAKTGAGDGAGYDGPFLLINTALNLVAGKEMAWQERMASSFVFTPLECGSAQTGYCPTFDYAGERSGGVKLSTAMTISGAAASPNSGYNSSPAVTALLTVFNARLGAWLGHPANPETRKHSSPTRGFWHLLKELFGLTSDECSYVYLSDGGHFENLGGYELVRRRCRYIILSDADADGTHVFENLGNFIHKCRADFGIRVEIDLESLKLAADTGRVRWHCAIGKIRYDDIDAGAIPGILVYVKPSLTGDEPADILHYAAQNGTFPHETTLDQFFSESQFEAYRALGQHVIEDVFANAVIDMKDDLEEIENFGVVFGADDQHRNENRFLFTAIARRWFAMPPEYEKSFVSSTEHYIELQRDLAEKAELQPISADMYRELKGSAKPPTAISAGKGDNAEAHTFLRMLQIMENAWLSLNLDVHFAHPLNRGWLDVFYRWTSGELFRKHWPVLRSEFSRRFVEFCERQMRVVQVETVVDETDIIPEELRREFNSHWATEAIDQHGAAEANKQRMASLGEWFAQTKKDGQTGWCWLIRSRVLKPANGHAQASTDGNDPEDAPVGLIIVYSEKPNEEIPVFEFLLWIRGAHRNMGIGRQAGRKVVKALRDKYRGRALTLRVKLPVSSVRGAGGKLLKAMWLTFYSNLDFHVTQWSEDFIVMEREFRERPSP